ncbi:MAG TPA: TolC family protein [Pirellulales bacterium]|nr:TolC family protein [Pirellulales bacterium]
MANRLPYASSDKLTGALLISGVILFVCAPADAQEPASPRLTLSDCIAVALRNQPAIHVQNAGVNVAREQRAVARSYYFPQLNFGMAYVGLSQPLEARTPNPISGQAANVFSDAAAYFGIARQAGPAAAQLALANPNAGQFAAIKHAFLAGTPQTINTELLGSTFLLNQLSLVQPLWTGRKIRYRNQQATLGVQIAMRDAAKSRQEAIFSVTRAYYGALLAQELVAVADQSSALFNTVVNVTDNLIQDGDEYVTMPDMLRARALADTVASERITAEKSRDLAIAALHQAMGVPIDAPLELADRRLRIDQRKVELPEVLPSAMVRRPELAKAQIGVQIVDLQRRLARAAFSPEVSLFGTYINLQGQQAFLDPNNPNLLAAGLSVQMPVFEGGRRLAESRKAADQQVQARQGRELARQLVALEVRQACLEYEEMRDRLRPISRAARDAQQALDGYWSQFAGDQIADEKYPDFFRDLLTTRLLLTQAQVQYYQVVFGHNLAVAKIELVSASNEDHSLVSAGGPARPERPPARSAGR